MKFGMFYPVAVASEADLGKGLWGLDRDRYATTIEELREQAICADETGWTSMMFAEHHFEIEGYHVTPNPLLLNVYLAQHTKRLRQGQMGLVLPNWNPLRLAEDIAMTDHLTGGRLDIGLSRGYQPRSVGVMGQHYRANAAGTGRAEVEAINRKIVEEWFEVMRRSWTEDLWNYQGEFISVPPRDIEWKHPISARLNAGVRGEILTQVATVPKPKQLPYPPLFTTLSQSPETLNWSARIGSSVVTLAANLDTYAGCFKPTSMKRPNTAASSGSANIPSAAASCCAATLPSAAPTRRQWRPPGRGPLSGRNGSANSVSSRRCACPDRKGPFRKPSSKCSRAVFRSWERPTK